MSDTAFTAEEALDRLELEDSTLLIIYLSGGCTDTIAIQLINCLRVRPNAVICIVLSCNKLTDQTGVRLAQYVAASATIQILNLCKNQFSYVTHLALAAALRVNTSLKRLYLFDKKIEDENRIDTAFIKRLDLDFSSSNYSHWHLYWPRDDLSRLRSCTQQLDTPSMLSQLDVCDSWHKKK